MAGPGRALTIAEAIHLRYELKVFCTNWDCERVKLLAARLTCKLCGKPGKLQAKAPPFDRGPGAGFGTAGQWPREPIDIPTPPDRPDTPEMKWHGKHRARRRRR